MQSEQLWSSSMATQYELQGKCPTVVTDQNDERPRDLDAYQLARIGKQPVLKVCTKRLSID